MLVVLAAIAAALALGGSAQAEVAIFEAAPAEAVERGKRKTQQYIRHAVIELESLDACRQQQDDRLDSHVSR